MKILFLAYGGHGGIVCFETQSLGQPHRLHLIIGCLQIKMICIKKINLFIK
jgi:hypothetical protein